MKNRTAPGKGVFTLSIAVLVSMVMIACNKNDDPVVNTPVAHLMAFNLAPDKPSVRVTLSGNTITNAPLAYTSFTGGYINIYAGTRTLESFDNNANTTIASTSFDFDTSRYYSVFVAGPVGTYRNIIVEDNYDSLSATNGKAYVRYINAVPSLSSPLVKVSAGGTDILNANAAFGTVSTFTAVNPGDVAIAVSNPEGDIQTTRTIPVVAKKVYTMLIVGEAGSTDTDKRVQVKFIENGSL